MRVEKDVNCYSAYDGNDVKILSVSTYETTMPKGGYESEDLCIIDAIDTYAGTTEQKLSALREIFAHIRDEYDRYPGIDNHFSALDSEELYLIGTLIEQGHIQEQLLLNTEDSMASISLDKEAIKNLANATTVQRAKTTFSGYVPYNHETIIRNPRSFAKERTGQLLRQMATQLYHFCRSKKFNPTEVQIMYFNDSLFISANSKADVLEIMRLLPNAEAIKQALTTPYQYKGSDSLDREISKRHAAKILARVYGSHPTNDARLINIKKLLNRATSIDSIELFDKKTKLEKLEELKIYFVFDHLMSDRHAEENLMDILDAFTLELFDQKNKPAIFGKKRPCLNCHARLDAMYEGLTEDFSIVAPFEFNNNPGIFFKNTTDRKNATLAATAKALGKYSNKVYVSAEGDSSYATCSDSEHEEEKEVTHSLSKISLKG